MNYYPHHIGDYAAATAHLSWDEDVAYTRLLRAYYQHEKPIPADIAQACRIARAVTSRQRQAVATVLNEFFTPQNDGWHQKRCDEELARAREKSQKAKDSAAQRWGNPTHTETAANTYANAFSGPMRPQCEGNTNQQPITNNQEPRINRLPTPDGAGVPDGTSAVAIPDCPHQEIIALYHEMLPMNPRVLEWNDTRRCYLRSRWKEKAKGPKGYTTVHDGLTFWRRYFGWVGESEFLTGQSAGKPDKPPFLADLEWLVKPGNFAKVVEGKYHDRKARAIT
jgi:uncharacterized protein YdaU (DUF1376 family)